MGGPSPPPKPPKPTPAAKSATLPSACRSETGFTSRDRNARFEIFTWTSSDNTASVTRCMLCYSPNPYDRPIEANPDNRVSTSSSSSSERSSDVPPIPSRLPEPLPNTQSRLSDPPTRSLPSVPEPHISEKWFHQDMQRDQASSAVRQNGKVRGIPEL